MFTGLVKDVGRIASVDEGDGSRRLQIRTDLETADFAIGESIAIDGACLTVTAIDDGTFAVELSPETLAKTTLEERETGDRLHLERALRVGDRLGGHFVQGHVDAVGRVVDRVDEGDTVRLRIEAPARFEGWLIDKGSITVDGVSLTVNDVDGHTFGVALIPHTLAQTKFDAYRPGRSVNLEGDMLGKYVERLVRTGASVDASAMEVRTPTTDVHDE